MRVLVYRDGDPTRRWIVAQLLDADASVLQLAAPLRAAETWMRRALRARYRDRLGSLPEDWRRP